MIVSDAVLELARRLRAENPRPPLSDEQARKLKDLFGPLDVPREER